MYTIYTIHYSINFFFSTYSCCISRSVNNFESYKFILFGDNFQKRLYRFPFSLQSNMIHARVRPPYVLQRRRGFGFCREHIIIQDNSNRILCTCIPSVDPTGYRRAPVPNKAGTWRQSAETAARACDVYNITYIMYMRASHDDDILLLYCFRRFDFIMLLSWGFFYW